MVEKKSKIQEVIHTMEYKVKNSNGEYFVDWVGQLPVFNSNIIMGKRLSEDGAKNLIKLLEEENFGLLTLVSIS